MEKPPIFAIPILDQWLVHSPLHEVTALVNSSALACLRTASFEKESTLAELHAELSAAPIHLPQVKQGPFDPKFLAIITTRGCNINCVYCDFGGPTSARVHMNPALAVEAIDWMAQRLVERGRTEFFLHFFGGEPFISGELVEIVVHRTRAMCARYGLKPVIDVSTNGVFNESRANWVGHYFDSVVLSFDGPPEFQNRNRPANGGGSTFEAVSRTAERLSQTPVELCLRVCVTGESVQRMEEITTWLVDAYHPAVINFEPLTENDLTSCSDLHGADPYDFARYWMAAKRAADRCGVRLVYSATEPGAPRLSSCPVGSDAVIISPDGHVNGCYLQPQDWLKHGMNMELGRVTLGAGLEIDSYQVEQVRKLITDKPRCRGCFCQFSCSGGCHVSNTYNGCSDDYVAFCLQTRIITACLLLEEMGCSQFVDALLADQTAMQRLATHSWDPVDLGTPGAAKGLAA